MEYLEKKLFGHKHYRMVARHKTKNQKISYTTFETNKNEHLANENNLKQKVDKLATEPDSTRNIKAYLDAKKSLARLQIAETKKKLIKDQYFSNFLAEEFLKDFLKKREQTTISKLVDEQGIQKSSPKEILNLAVTFYSKLYQKDEISTSNKFFFGLTHTKISDKQKEDLEIVIKGEEIESAICSMSKGKSPGPDSLSIEFYQECWPIIKNEISLLLGSLFAVPEINEKFKSDFLTLIHKKGDREQLANYRPISLLNYDLKIITKILVNRLKKIIGTSFFIKTSMRNMAA